MRMTVPAWILKNIEHPVVMKFSIDMNPKFRAASLLVMFCCLVMFLTGCGTTPKPTEGSQADKKIFDDSDEIRVGDMLKITFRGTVSTVIPDHEDRVSEQGYINLPQIGEVKAAGKDRIELQKEITELYVPYFKHLTVTIAPDQRFFYVNGEVKKVDRYFYAGEMNVLRAISTAGGFTNFADKTKVRLIRADGTIEIVNCKKALDNPGELNIEVLPGDTINVPMRIF
jgi:protein involved in polysaccharide export with SLBB domain